MSTFAIGIMQQRRESWRFRSFSVFLFMSEGSKPAQLLCLHEVGGRGRFVYQQRARLAVASTFVYMFLNGKSEHNKGRKMLNNARKRASVGVAGHYPFVCIVNRMRMHCQWPLENPTSVAIPTRTKDDTNQREPSRKCNGGAFSLAQSRFRRFCRVEACH